MLLVCILSISTISATENTVYKDVINVNNDKDNNLEINNQDNEVSRSKDNSEQILVENHNNFIHIEVDKIVDEELSHSKKLIDRVNKLIGKKYTFSDIKNCYFENTEESKQVNDIFLDELNKTIVRIRTIRTNPA